LLDNAVFDIVRLKTLPDLVEEIEDVVHAERRGLISANETIEETSS